MGSSFARDIAFLDGTEFAKLLAEIGRTPVSIEDTAPSAVFVAKTHAYCMQLRSMINAKTADAEVLDKQCLESLRIIGLVKNLSDLEVMGFRQKVRRLPYILLGVVRYEASESVRHLSGWITRLERWHQQRKGRAQ